MCVSCKELTGDEPLVRRYDEPTRDGVVETTFVSNQYASRALARSQAIIAPESAFDIAIGDDANLTRERGAGIGAGSLRDAIVEYEDDFIEKIDNEKLQPFARGAAA